MQIILKGLTIALIFSTFTLNAQFSVSIQVNQTIHCNGGNNGSLTAVVSPAGSAYTFSWSNGGSTATITDLTADTYMVTVQNAAGGSAIATGILTEPEALVLTPLTELPLPVNPVGTVDVETSGGTAPYAFQWVNDVNIPFSNEEDLVDAPAGIYTQTATDANGCTAILSPVELIAASGTDNVFEIPAKVFPNPVSKELHIEMQGDGSQRVQIFNAMGQMIDSRMVLDAHTTIPVENFPGGYYTLVFPGLAKTVRVLVER